MKRSTEFIQIGLLLIIAAFLGAIWYKMPATPPTRAEWLRAAQQGKDARAEIENRVPFVEVRNTVSVNGTVGIEGAVEMKSSGFPMPVKIEK